MSIEQKALELVNAERTPDAMPPIKVAGNAYGKYGSCWLALCRAIEAHEAYKQRFSEAAAKAIEHLHKDNPAWAILSPFIIAKPDPLVEVMRATGMDCLTTTEGGADLLKRAADRLGYEFAIVAKEGE